jgi:hypothetical protein
MSSRHDRVLRGGMLPVMLLLALSLSAIFFWLLTMMEFPAAADFNNAKGCTTPAFIRTVRISDLGLQRLLLRRAALC